MAETTQAPTLESPTTPGRPAAEKFAAVYGGLLALVYLALGGWAAVTGAWHSGALLSPGGSAAVSVATNQALSLVLVVGWLALGLAWPVRTARPWVWISLGVLQLAVLLVAGLWLWVIGVLVLHLLAFDPRWLPRVVPAEPEPMFFDGHCGLCHRWVKIVMHADRDGKLFYFAPLQGDTIKGLLTDAQRDALPDSIVIRTNDGRVLSKSSAVVYILTALGGWHRLAALGMRLVPGPVRDLGYDSVAKVRHRIFAKPSEACPMMPPELRGRFRF